MFLILIIIIIIILLLLNCNVENFTSGGTNIDLNSNDASLNQTTLTQYRPYWLPTFYEYSPKKYYEDDIVIYPSSYGDYPLTKTEFTNTVSDDFNINSDGDINRNYSCKNNNIAYRQINDYIVSNDYVQVKI